MVDTNRPDQVECKPLLESLRRVVVIDHHRRAADYIEQPVLNLHEPVGLLSLRAGHQRCCNMRSDASDITANEAAAALLSGIVLDTKNFGVRTSSRTFEAAAFLRRIGADPVMVKKLFQNDLPSTLERYRAVQAAKLYRDNLAIAALDYTINRTIAAQAADELLNISGIDTSFVPLSAGRPDHHLGAVDRRGKRAGDPRAAGRRRQRTTAGAQIKTSPSRTRSTRCCAPSTTISTINHKEATMKVILQQDIRGKGKARSDDRGFRRLCPQLYASA